MTEPKTFYMQQLWTLSLAVSAFAIAQTIAFAFKLGDKDFALEVSDGWRIVIFATWLSAFLYIAATLIIDKVQIGLITPSEKDVIHAI